jgi:hypothetical protein
MEKNKNSLNEVKNDSPEIYKRLVKPKKALVFSFNEEIRQRLTHFVYKRFRYSTYALQDKQLLITELYFTPYRTIWLDIDSIFTELDEILDYIHDKGSKNKHSITYLITSSKENSSKLRKIKLHKKIILLLKEKEIIYLIGGQKMPPL